MVGGVDAQQRALAGSAGQDRHRDRGRGLRRAVDGAGAAPQRRRRRRAGARRFRRRRLDAQRRHDLGRHQSRQGSGRQEPDRRGVRAQEGRADGRGRRFAHRARGHHRPRGIECGLHKNGRFVGAWTPKHYADLATKVETYNKYANAGARWCRANASASSSRPTITYGGMYATRAGHLHPALYYKGLLEAAHRQGAILCANVEAERIEKIATGWRVLTVEGTDRLPRSGGRHQRLYRRPDAAAEAPRRAGGEPHHRHRGTARARELADPRAARCRRHQAGADLLPALARRQAADLRRPRALHRGAARGERAGALPIHDRPLPAARRHPHHPCVDGQRGLRARLHAAHGHRRGPALPAGLQRQRRRHDDLSRHPDRQEDRRRQQRADQPAGRPRVPRARRSTTANRGSCR